MTFNALSQFKSTRTKSYCSQPGDILEHGLSVVKMASGLTPDAINLVPRVTIALATFGSRVLFFRPTVIALIASFCFATTSG